MFGCLPCPMCRKYPNISIEVHEEFPAINGERPIEKTYYLDHHCQTGYSFTTSSLSKEWIKERWNTAVRELEEDKT